MKTYLFEAGATKTELLYSLDGLKQEITLPGFNPNRDNGSFELALQDLIKLDDEARVFFYGAGLGNEKNKTLVRQIFSKIYTGRVSVYDDIVGAARAAFKDKPGIISIMGTGGLAAYYDGKEIIKRRGGYGYLIDDLGGGFELGREVLSAWLNGDLSEATELLLSDKLQIEKSNLIATIYERKDLDFIATIPKIVGAIQDDKGLDLVIGNYFDHFFQKNVIPLKEAFEMTKFSVVGGVGTGFYRVIRRLSTAKGLQMEQCIESPIQRLFDYHLAQS